MSDLDLLQNYAGTNSQEAFAALVSRYLNLVYSAAQRQVRSPQLAEEIAQSVFIDLSRNASKIQPAQPLAAWLFLVTRRTAVDVIRRESRRQAREQAAAEIAAMKTPSPTWSQVSDVVDDAMEALNEAERSAILLRFFENRSLREVGDSLGVSEDTAQKRVSRALDRLRTLLLRRGVAVSAAGLATDLSAHGIQAAPAALGAAIVSNASLSTTAGGVALAKVTQAAALTTVQKTLAGAAAAIVLGVAGYQAAEIWQQRFSLATLTEDADQLRALLAQLRRGEDAAARQLQSARASLTQLSAVRGAVDPELENAVEAWFERSRRLKLLAATRADLNSPELEVLSDNHWLTIAKNARFETEEQIHDAFEKLYRSSRESLARRLREAVTRYAAAHAGQLPGTANQLATFMEPPVSDSLLDRFEMLQSGAIQAQPRGEWVLAERPALTERHDTRIFVAAQNYGIEDLTAISDREVRLAGRAFAEAHGGQLPVAPAQLVPYFKNAPRAAALKAFLEGPEGEFATRLKEIVQTH